MPERKALALKEFLAQSLHGGKKDLHKLLASGPGENQSLLLMVKNRGGLRYLQQPSVMAVDDTREAMRVVGWHRVAQIPSCPGTCYIELAAWPQTRRDLPASLPSAGKELNRTCRAMQHRIVELISRVSNEEVTEELLHVNDDLNNVFLRYERFERYRSGRSVQNASNGVLSEVTEDNLIDLGPGSPAVVSPMVGSTAPPSSLSSQLAGLDLGTESVSGTLSSLQQCKPQDGFDMFAQTRGNSLAEQRKTVTYEDPQAVGGLASALDNRKQNSEMEMYGNACLSAWQGRRRLPGPPGLE